jgi:hypothetical protein
MPPIKFLIVKGTYDLQWGPANTGIPASLWVNAAMMSLPMSENNFTPHTTVPTLFDIPPNAEYACPQSPVVDE